MASVFMKFVVRGRSLMGWSGLKSLKSWKSLKSLKSWKSWKSQRMWEFENLVDGLIVKSWSFSG